MGWKGHEITLKRKLQLPPWTAWELVVASFENTQFLPSEIKSIEPKKIAEHKFIALIILF